MTWYMYTAELRAQAVAVKQIEIQKQCPLCYSKLQRLAWREMLPPYHWQPFGWICSMCNAVFVGYDSRGPKSSRSMQAGLLSEIGIEAPTAPPPGFKPAKAKRQPRTGPVQAAQ